MKSLNLTREEREGQSLEIIGQEEGLELDMDTGILSHAVDRSVVVDSTMLVVELLKMCLHLLQVFENKEEQEIVRMLRDMIIIKLREVATTTEGEGRGEMGEGDLEGEEVGQKQSHSIGPAVKLAHKQEGGTMVGGEGGGMDPLIIDREVTGTTRGPEVMHSCSHTLVNITVIYVQVNT